MKLYLFAVGGTGERVITSLVMLLASGMKIELEVIPVFFDTDKTGKALERANELIDSYIKIRNKIVRFEYQTPLFYTKINRAENVVIDGVQVEHLKNLIDLRNLSNDGKAELHLLFSENNLEMPLDLGFIGNPNVGSIALNYLLSLSQYRTIQSGISENDKVFIISSIFGGTGAAGFPLLLNKLRTEKNVGNGANIVVGGATILPYFDFISDEVSHNERNLDTNKYNVNSDSFTAKTRAALMYYDTYVKGNGLSSLYYLGDDRCRSKYTKVLGGKFQDNPANLIEVLSAMSIFHFTNSALPYDETIKTTFYHYGLGGENINENSFNLDLNNIPNNDKDFKKALVRFQLFKVIWEKFVPNYINNNATWAVNSGFNSNLYEGHELAKELKKIFGFYQEWKDGLDYNNHGRRFKYFKDDANYDEKTVTAAFIPSKIANTKTSSFIKKETTTIDPNILSNMNGCKGKSGGETYTEDESTVFAVHCISEAIENIFINKVTL